MAAAVAMAGAVVCIIVALQYKRHASSIKDGWH
eukprot:CAMPEP_0172750600 /NCGR_PEP_ID=MMETSP1074-20121228/149929_1 /TAXON_ID=2916 /ORGANISM="Ceratium fusus, Strain PA161109" /LENGTH=32 /DNA_ID= /DNA_START= /DNA_END= /DNA_ORIENTATION=